MVSSGTPGVGLNTLFSKAEGSVFPFGSRLVDVHGQSRRDYAGDTKGVSVKVGFRHRLVLTPQLPQASRHTNTATRGMR